MSVFMYCMQAVGNQLMKISAKLVQKSGYGYQWVFSNFENDDSGLAVKMLFR